jgi:hypothetical protein
MSVFDALEDGGAVSRPSCVSAPAGTVRAATGGGFEAVAEPILPVRMV